MCVLQSTYLGAVQIVITELLMMIIFGKFRMPSTYDRFLDFDQEGIIYNKHQCFCHPLQLTTILEED